MLHITDLPLIVVDLIIQFATKHMEIYGNAAWHQYIPLLAVNRTWRNTLKLKAYRHAYFNKTRLHRARQSKTRTNIGLIKFSNNTHLAKTLELSLDNHTCVGQFLDQYLSVFEFVKHGWTNVTTVKFRINPVSAMTVGIITPNPHDELVPQLSCFIEQLVQHMPNVNTLVIKSSIESRLTRTLSTELIYGYKYNLRSVVSDLFMPLNLAGAFGNLTQLNISLNPASEILIPKVNIEIIQLLRLTNVPLYFSWNILLSDKNTKMVEFSSLKTLKLEFVKEKDDNTEYSIANANTCDSNDSIGSQISFPKLQNIIIINNPGADFANQIYKFSEQLYLINITNSLSTLYMLSKFNTQSVGVINIRFSNINRINEHEFYKSTNLFFKSNRKYTSSVIDLFHVNLNIDWEQIKWQTLDYLKIDDCEFNTMLIIIEKLPTLKKLELYRLFANDLPEHINDLMFFTYPSQLSVQPIKSNIEYLGALLIAGNNIKPNVFVSCTQHLLLQLTSLKSLDIFNCTWMGLVRFVEEYKLWFPHLANVDVGIEYDKANKMMEQSGNTHLFSLMGSGPRTNMS
ncbi:hypothetical protein BX661DRAFT_188213 [Kickxella alabastrina]|uniref:uncharacterized protein n=1 Tax=Kickxella alabastrina TaxID=61397 RepID=UPI00221F7B6B|nr:uncharacterized protein BX661DRAFT_188213 [Kickxella alabastrina]KAI7821644.1 hypothetical protein BX661DRAFT_188213 [Kickxella alabastrina]